MNGWKRGLGIGVLLSLPTLLAVLLAVWFDSGHSQGSEPRSHAAAGPQNPVDRARASARPTGQPATLVASAAAAATQAQRTRHASLNEYTEAVENRRRTRLDAAFDAGAPAPIWTAEVSSYVKDALSHLEHGGNLRSVECRTTVCRVIVDLPQITAAGVDEFTPMPEHEQQSFATLNDTGGAIVTYYLAPEGARLKSITENQYK